MQRSIAFYLSLLAFFLLITSPSKSFAWPAKVLSVTDGDTINVERKGRQLRVRLYGIDAPEMNQSFGQKAKELTSSLILGRNVDVEQKDIDRYGRIVGLVKIDGQGLNELIIQNGYAWVYQQYCKENFCSEWNQSEAAARKQKKGLWSDPVAIAPWDWRHHKSAPQRPGVAKDNSPLILVGGDMRIDGGVSGGQSKCDGRTSCSQMTSCQEATFFLNNCAGSKMDGDGDGVPCEKQWCK
ncbi:thermonuclease family protein [Desulfobulbus sp.]|uniref:thermonuclease family protein n=1 Tax=Desulfobulbus sp. TaxID=895 RepID=UPI0027B9D9A9|nr:thermonuclease family protein [Desulfobulbus sp.]